MRAKPKISRGNNNNNNNNTNLCNAYLHILTNSATVSCSIWNLFAQMSFSKASNSKLNERKNSVEEVQEDLS